jgi:hypothetical protein
MYRADPVLRFGVVFVSVVEEWFTEVIDGG